MSAVSTNFHNKKVRYKIVCYILRTVLIVVILLLITTIIFCHYTNQECIDALTSKAIVWGCSVKKFRKFKNFEKFTGKQLCQSLFFKTCNLLKKKNWCRCFLVNFAISKSTFYRTPLFAASLTIKMESNTSGVLLFRWQSDLKILIFNILIDEKSYENVLIYNISYRTLIGPTPLRIRFDKIDRFIRVYNGTRYLISFGPENVMSFAIELDTL